MNSTNHNIISQMYLVISLISSMLSTSLSLVIRSENFSCNRGVVVSQSIYNALVTCHAFIMIFFFLIPTILSGFANYLLPLYLSVGDLAFPRLNALSLWLLVPGLLMMILSCLYSNGCSTSWTLYPPLTLKAAHEEVGVDCAIFSLHLASLSSLSSAVNMITTVVCFCQRGSSVINHNVYIWSILVTIVLLGISLPVLASSITMLLLDRNFSSVFFIPDGGGDPVMFQHLFWFFSHPEVYVLILPGFGICCQIITFYTSMNRIVSVRSIIWSIISLSFMGFIVWSHHMFTSGLDVDTRAYFTAATLVIAIPTSVNLLTWGINMWLAPTNGSGVMLWIQSFIWLFVVSSVTGVILANNSVDLLIHDTYFVVAHFHYVLSMSAVFITVAAMYHWCPLLLSVKVSSVGIEMHFYSLFAASNMTFFPIHFLSLGSMPRRYHGYSEEFLFLNQVSSVSSFMSLGSWSCMLLSLRMSTSSNPLIMGAVDHNFNQSESAIEFCYGSYLADNHTHMEIPFCVKNPWLSVGNVVKEQSSSVITGVFNEKDLNSSREVGSSEVDSWGWEEIKEANGVYNYESEGSVNGGLSGGSVVAGWWKVVVSEVKESSGVDTDKKEMAVLIHGFGIDVRESNSEEGGNSELSSSKSGSGLKWMYSGEVNRSGWNKSSELNMSGSKGGVSSIEGGGKSSNNSGIEGESKESDVWSWSGVGQSEKGNSESNGWSSGVGNKTSNDNNGGGSSNFRRRTSLIPASPSLIPISLAISLFCLVLSIVIIFNMGSWCAFNNWSISVSLLVVVGNGLIWAKALELEYFVLSYITRSVHHIYLTAFSYLIVIELCTFFGLIYPFIAAMMNPPSDIGMDVCGASGTNPNPFRTPLINTLLLVYMSMAANWTVRKVNVSNVSGGIVFLTSAIAMATSFLFNQFNEFRALLTIKFSDSIFSCSIMSVLGLHGSHVAFAWLWMGYNIVIMNRGQIRSGLNPGLVNMVTYIHFTDVVWVIVINVFYLWPWISVSESGKENSSIIGSESLVLLDESCMWIVVMGSEMILQGDVGEGDVRVILGVWSSMIVILVSGGVSWVSTNIDSNSSKGLIDGVVWIGVFLVSGLVIAYIMGDISVSVCGMWGSRNSVIMGSVMVWSMVQALNLAWNR